VQTTARLNRLSAPGQIPGVRVLLLTDQPAGLTARRLAALGALVDVRDGLQAAMTAILYDAIGFDLFVMDCDEFGGIDAGERAIASLIAAEARMRVMLVSRDFDIPAFPMGRRTAVCLPMDCQEASFRRGYDHALRDRQPILMM
jgi:hypothetical protein